MERSDGGEFFMIYIKRRYEDGIRKFVNGNDLVVRVFNYYNGKNNYLIYLNEEDSNNSNIYISYIARYYDWGGWGELSYSYSRSCLVKTLLKYGLREVIERVLRKRGIWKDTTDIDLNQTDWE